MAVGTRCVLFGAQGFWLHIWLLAAAWVRIFGIPWEIRLWVAFAVHDLGYVGKKTLKGRMAKLTSSWAPGLWVFFSVLPGADFAACHSRYWANRMNPPVSALCIADKLAFVLTPAWLYLPMTRATGELAEYMRRAKERQALANTLRPRNRRNSIPPTNGSGSPG
jgi:hypothetical protein